MSPAKMIHHDGARCQWFDMSPRQSLGSDGGPPRDFGNDENNVENVAPNVVKRQVIGKDKPVAKTAKAQARPANAATQQAQTSTRGLAVRRPGTPQSARATLGREQVLPCMRPATPTKSRKEGSAAPTPERSVMYEDSCNTSVNTSVCYSELSCSMSCSSRLDQLSRRSTNRRAISSEELQMQQMEEKRRALQSQVRRNQKNVVKSRVPPENCCGRYERSTRVTMPKEFNLSVGTPRADHSDGEDSVGSARKSRVASTKKVWRPQLGNPQLTVPRGPSFLERSARRSISCPPKDEDRDDRSEFSVGSVSVGSVRVRAGTPEKRFAQPTRGSTPERRTQPTRGSTPERRSCQPTRATTPDRRNVPAVRPATPEGRNGQPGRAPTPERQQIGRQATADRAFHERAERARQAAVAKNDEEVVKKDHRALFTRKSPTQSAASSEAKTQPKPLQRRSSFGTATRPCCDMKK